MTRIRRLVVNPRPQHQPGSLFMTAEGPHHVRPHGSVPGPHVSLSRRRRDGPDQMRVSDPNLSDTDKKIGSSACCLWPGGRRSSHLTRGCRSGGPRPIRTHSAQCIPSNMNLLDLSHSKIAFWGNPAASPWTWAVDPSYESPMWWWVPLDPPMFAPCRRRPTAPLETQRRCRQRRRSFLSLSRASLWRPPLSYFGSRVVETRKKGAFLRRRQAHVGGACAWPIAPPMTELSSTGRGTGFDGSQSLVSPPFSISGSMQTPPPGICGRRRGTRGAGGARLDEFWLLPKARSSWTEKYRQGNEPSHGISRQPPGWIIHLVRS